MALKNTLEDTKFTSNNSIICDKIQITSKIFHFLVKMPKFDPLSGQMGFHFGEK